MPADGGLATTTNVDSHSVASTHSLTLGPTSTNEARFGFTRITANFGFPIANINAAGVGAITSADEPRRVQLALKLIF